jgi:hypothetical protein
VKPRFSNRRNHALTLIEVLVVIAVLGLLAVVAIVVVVIAAANHGASRINCVNNLHKIGIAYQIWADEHGGKFPMQVSTMNGGTMELSTNGRNAWVNFVVMSNELRTPKLLICPADKSRFYATNFAIDFNNANVSYFVGLDASTNNPQTFLSGDDNFAIGGIPIKSGLLELSTNAPISWTATRHKFADNIGVGDIGLADGSIQEVTSNGLHQAFQQTSLATNRLAIP